jgi:hypothetical protein
MGLPAKFLCFRGEWLKNDYIKGCKTWTCMVMQNRAWMTTFLFKEFSSLFKKLVPNGISQFNRQILILNNHGSHVTLEAIGQAQHLVIHDYIACSYIHALQALGVNCFKPFKLVFKKKTNSSMVKNNHYEPNKCPLTRMGGQGFGLGMMKNNIKSRFKATRIRPFTPKAMDD